MGSRIMVNRRIASLLVVVASLLALPAAASGASLVGKPLQKSIWGPVEVNGVSQFPLYRDLDVDIFQIQVRWERVAREGRPADPTNPADPLYRWPRDVDLAVQEAQRHGIKVLILVQGTPTWANQNREWQTAPDDVNEYALFLTAVARRYPTVRHWMVWGEPTRNLFVPGADRSPAGRKLLAQTYARLLDAGYGALKSASPANIVIGGNTFTSDRQPADYSPVPVYEWIRNVRLPNGKVPRMDIWGHNPYTYVNKLPRLKGRTRNYGDVADLDGVLTALRRRIARPLRRRHMPIFISEFCLPTGPNYLFPLELTLRQQATWLRRVLSISRSQRAIWGFGGWRLQDDAEALDPAARVIRCGLVDGAFQPKPAFQAFKRAKTSRRR